MNFFLKSLGSFSFFPKFAARKHQEQSLLVSGLTNRAYYFSHGGRYDAEDNYKLQKQKVVRNHIYYIKFALRFADMQISELVNVFNSQVHNRGWSSMRAYNNLSLVDEFKRRGIDTSIISDGLSISFAHPIAFDIETNKLILI